MWLDYSQYVADIDRELPEPEPPREWVEIGRWPLATRADEYALVLTAVGIRSVIAVDEGQHELIVRAEDAERARDHLQKFAAENRGWPARPVTLPPMTGGPGAALIYAALMSIAFAAQQQHSYGVDWLSTGAADAALIRTGEWWRALTALTLHGDGVHLIGNLVFGALFGVMLAQSVGAGAAWLTFVLAGGIGNGINAWWQSPGHLAIGASTGVFGLLGAQVACDWMRRGRGRHHPMRRWAPIIMGVALLAWFGGSGERQINPGDVIAVARDTSRVDIAAHVFGFLSGVGFGTLAASRVAWRLRSARVQHLMTTVAIGAVVVAWAIALR